MFSSKWLSSQLHRGSKQITRMQKFTFFRHTSPIIVSIIDKLSIINNKYDEENSEAHAAGSDTKFGRGHLGKEAHKYLTFLELFAHNRLNLLCMKQLHAQDYLLELLKFFSQGEKIDQYNEKIIIKVLNCLALIIRNT